MKEISLYVHIPFCVKKCDYCDFLSGVYDEQMQREYTNSLCREIAYMGQQLFLLYILVAVHPPG